LSLGRFTFEALNKTIKNKIMNLASLRIITADIKRLVSFLEHITNLKATWYTEDFAEITTSSSTLAIGSTKTLSLFGEGIAEPANNKSVIIEFRVENVDTEYERIKDFIKDVVQEPTTMPWGNRSLLFRDPDGNLINFFAPVTPEAIQKFN
jgi:predicted enzyme related to lactoylglutathione lyase